MNSTLFHVVVCCAMINSEKKVLLGRRRSEKKLGGKWEFPGGKIHLGEEVEDALKREIWEELEIEIQDPKILHIKTHAYPHGNVLILFYTCKNFSGKPKLKDHDQFLWCTV